jgi:hypothetical protein
MSVFCLMCVDSSFCFVSVLLLFCFCQFSVDPALEVSEAHLGVPPNSLLFLGPVCLNLLRRLTFL